MTNKNTSNVAHAFRYGLYITAASIVLMLISYIFGLVNNGFIGVLSWIVILVGLFLSAYKFREEKLNGFISYGSAFSVIFLTGLFYGILMAPYIMLHFGLIAPEVLDQMMYEVQKQIADTGQVTQEQFDALRTYQENFTYTWWGMGIGKFLGGLLWGVIGGLLLSLIIKKENPNRSPFN